MAPPILTWALDRGEWSASHLGHLRPGKEPTVPIVYGTECASEAVWTRWSREKSHAHAGNRTPAVQPVARRYTY
jgi:hypothetical protein